jgi:hypothetical protein
MAFACAALAVVFSITLNVSAASFPPTPLGISIVNSTHFPGRTISFKEVSISAQLSRHFDCIRIANNQGRPKFARQQKGSRHTVDTSTFLPILVKGDHSKFIPTFGFSRLEITRRMHRSLFGSKVGQACPLLLRRLPRTGLALCCRIQNPQSLTRGRGTTKSTCSTSTNPLKSGSPTIH